MLTFTDTPVTKEMLITSLGRHALADAFIKGTYGRERDDGKGCAVGCSLREFTKKQSSHSEYERLFGTPKVLAHLEDGIFEGLPLAESKLWPLQFANAIPVGRDLSMVWPKFAHWLLVDEKFGAINFARPGRARKAILRVSALYSRCVDGDKPSKKEWNDAADDAAAYAAAVAADYAAAYAAAVAADGALKNHRIAQSKYLIKLLSEA